MYLETSVGDGVGMIRLAREDKRNALSEALRDELERQMVEFAQDPAVRVLSLTGGDRVFSAGFDLDEVADSGFGTFGHRMVEWNRALYECPKPVVVGVAGPAMAGGFDLALCGDVIIAADNAVFGHPEIEFGAVPSVALLESRVGLARARELCLTGRRVTAPEALSLGIVDRVVPAGDLMGLLTATARGLATKPAGALAGVRRAGWEHAGIVERLRREYELSSAATADPANVALLRGYLDSLRER